MENKKVIHKVFYAVALIVISMLMPHTVVTAEENTTFNVNVQESLSVSIATPATWASGSVGSFLRNKVSVNVVSNNSAGFTASMTTKTTDTALTNTAKNTYTIPTLSSAVQKGSFPANYWGYSLDDTDAGNNSSTYNALVGAGSTPVTILSSANATTGSKDFYFGAKADITKASGTYMGTVVISVVSGVVDNSTNPITPTNPVTPGTDQVANYDSGSGRTSYTYSSTSGSTKTTTTQISSGDNRSAYEGYTPPQGVTRSAKTSTSNGANLAAGLGIAAAIAATSGFFLFVAVRRGDEDDDEDEK